jgi:predicted transglutaminase-like cysteine proteinase
VFALIIALVAMTGAFAGPAAAEAVTHKALRLVHATERLPLATSISVGEATLTPYGWVDFCNRTKGECDPAAEGPQDIALTPQTWELIRRINQLVNTMIKPMSDMEHWGVIDQWDLPLDGYGDCEDYALLKRKMLVEHGLPVSALLMTIVKDENDEGHAVLTVKSDRGDFILDNMRTAVRPWAELPYRFVKRQSQSDPNVWEQIGEPTSAPLTVSR